MAILGVGIDVVDLDRFSALVARTPRMLDRLFVGDEIGRPVHSLAARFAAKEALAKALGAPRGLSWHDAEVVSEETGRPTFVVRGSVQAAMASLNATSVHLSLSHDAGIASAMVILEGSTER